MVLNQSGNDGSAKCFHHKKCIRMIVLYNTTMWVNVVTWHFQHGVVTCLCCGPLDLKLCMCSRDSCLM